MSKKSNKETNLFKTLLESGREEVSPEFSSDLKQKIVEKYSHEPEEKAFENPKLGKMILSLLLILHLILLYLYQPSLSSSFVFYMATIGFLASLWSAIFLFKILFLSRIIQLN